MRVGIQNAEFRDRFQALLQVDHPEGWRAGWRLAADTGSAVAPLLSELWQGEGPRLKSRLLLSAALSLADRAAGDAAIGAALPRLDDQELVMVALVFAAGPRRDLALPGLDRLTLRPGKPAVRIAAYAALARFPTDPPPLRAQNEREDPGLFAAALYAGVSFTDRELEPWFRDRGGPRAHRHLVWRGLLLCARQPDAGRAERLRRAVQIIKETATATSPEIRDARRAAALCVARLGDPSAIQVDLGEPDPDLLAVLATSRPMRDALPPGLLVAVPSPLAEPAVRRRLAVAYALSAPVGEILSGSGDWIGDAEVRGPLALTLAWRLLQQGPPQVPVPGAIAGIPGGRWVLWAAGQELPSDRDPPGSSDRDLDRAWHLATAGRLPAEAARRVLELRLWRTGSHPGLAAVEARMALLRDLLLSGSNEVSARLGVDTQSRYFPAGIPRTDNRFFAIAYEFLQFASTPREIPPGLGLR